MDQDQIDIPSYFLCPISLEIMKDPVTVATGITYDRDAIERWIYSSKNATCPVTKQPVSVADMELTPNHTLRRLIQSWCTLNAVERIPTPKPPVSRAHLTKLFSRAQQGGGRHLAPSLRQLRSIALESAANCRALESSGAIQFLSSVINNNNRGEEEEVNATVDLAVSVLSYLKISEADLLGLQKDQNDVVLIKSLTRIIHLSSNTQCAVQLLKSVLEAAHPTQLANLKPELFSGLVRVLQDPDSEKTTTKDALKNLIHVLPWGRNRIKAVEAGAVGAMVEILLAAKGAESRRVCEMAMVVVEQMCGCAEGRAELVGHGGGLAVVSKRVLRVSRVATERGVRALWAVAKYYPEAGVVKEMAEVGVVAKLCLVLQVECDSKTKERAKDILRMHAGAWKDSPCVPSQFHRSLGSV